MTKLAGIEYRGTAGISKHCINAVTEMIHFGRMLNTVKILTTGNEYHYNHALLINIDVGIDVAIKSGFTSGYPGEGPRSFSYILSVLSKYTDEIDEYVVPQKFIQRIDNSALTLKDLDWLFKQTPLRPQRWYDYIYERHTIPNQFTHYFPTEIPIALIDDRLLDIALSLKQNPDNALMTGYRLLEQIIKEKSGLTKETGAKLFSKAFTGENSSLCWENLDGSESTGRANMFSSIFMAFRNRRAHQQLDSNACDELREFMLLNQLFILERSTKVRKLERQNA